MAIFKKNASHQIQFLVWRTSFSSIGSVRAGGDRLWRHCGTIRHRGRPGVSTQRSNWIWPYLLRRLQLVHLQSNKENSDLVKDVQNRHFENGGPRRGSCKDNNRKAPQQCKVRKAVTSRAHLITNIIGNPKLFQQFLAQSRSVPIHSFHLSFLFQKTRPTNKSFFNMSIQPPSSLKWISFRGKLIKTKVSRLREKEKKNPPPFFPTRKSSAEAKRGVVNYKRVSRTRQWRYIDRKGGGARDNGQFSRAPTTTTTIGSSQQVQERFSLHHPRRNNAGGEIWEKKKCFQVRKGTNCDGVIASCWITWPRGGKKKERQGIERTR